MKRIFTIIFLLFISCSNSNEDARNIVKFDFVKYVESNRENEALILTRKHSWITEEYYNDNQPYLVYALDNNCYELSDIYLKMGKDIDIRFGRHDITPLFYFSYNGSMQQIDYLIERGANPNGKNDNEYGSTILMAVCSEKPNPMVVKALIDAGANVDVTKNGRSVLDYAYSGKNENVIRLIKEEMGKGGTMQ